MPSRFFVVAVAVALAACGRERATSALAEADFIEGADEVAPDCSDESIATFAAMPIDHDDPARGTFAYRYAHRVRDPSAPTLVFLPGGPGNGSIGGDPGVFFGAPNFLTIDPRGVGCNFGERMRFRAGELTTRQHALDVLAVIEKLELRDYILYGASYGTVAATVLAHEAEKAGHAPKAVILEGIVGAPFTRDAAQTMDEQWRAVVAARPSAKPFVASLPLGLSSQEWLGFLTQSLYRGPGALVSVLERIEAVVRSGNAEQMASYRQALTAGGAKAPLGHANLFAAVGCRELYAPDSLSEVDLVDGMIRMRAQTAAERRAMCRQYEFDAPYDPRAYPIRAKIYYFQGSNDPATPVGLARRHLQAQVAGAQKQWVEVKGAGHAPLMSGAPYGVAECAETIWQRITALADFDGVLKADGTCAN